MFYRATIGKRQDNGEKKAPEGRSSVWGCVEAVSNDGSTHPEQGVFAKYYYTVCLARVCLRSVYQRVHA